MLPPLRFQGPIKSKISCLDLIKMYFSLDDQVKIQKISTFIMSYYRLNTNCDLKKNMLELPPLCFFDTIYFLESRHCEHGYHVDMLVLHPSYQYILILKQGNASVIYSNARKLRN